MWGSRRKAAALVIWFWIAGCGGVPPLEPVVSNPPEAVSEAVHASVTPIVTGGFRSPDRSRYGIDLSAYYTAFDVMIRNTTGKKATLDLGGSTLRGENREYRLLVGEERIAYYRSAGLPGRPLVLVPKPVELARAEIDRIQSLKMPEGDLTPGEERRGVLLFEKIPQEECGQVRLALQDIRLEGDPDPKRIEFTFTCSRL